MRWTFLLAIATACTIERDVLRERPEPCTDDRQCTAGAQICTSGSCVACPAVATCAACPDHWIHLQRNGCDTCDCGPAPQCSEPDATCAAGVCYAGANCTEGCAPGDPGCCADACAPTGCTSPAPLGCLMQCTPELVQQGCTTCASDSCDCVQHTLWVCNAVCADGLRLPCAVP